MAKKNKERQTIGKMSNSRGTWEINPVTKIKENSRKKNDRKKVKQSLKEYVG